MNLIKKFSNYFSVNEKQERPFIIWTLRRTGGTNLAESLFKASKYNAIEHEPFNLDRKLGYIHKQWRENQNHWQLRKNLKQALQNKPLIKHCVEITPNEFNVSLIKIATKLGYQHIFLYREFPKDRLLSLNFAIQTGIWGSKKRDDFDHSIFSSPINIEHLIKDEVHCRNHLKFVFNAVKNKKRTHCISFEQLYTSNKEQVLNILENIFIYIGLQHSSIENFYHEVIGSGNLGTKNIYKNFVNYGEFESAMAQFKQFKLP